MRDEEKASGITVEGELTEKESLIEELVEIEAESDSASKQQLKDKETA